MNDAYVGLIQAIGITATIVLGVVAAVAMIVYACLRDGRRTAERYAAERAMELRKHHVLAGTLPCQVCGHDPKAPPIEITTLIGEG